MSPRISLKKALGFSGSIVAGLALAGIYFMPQVATAQSSASPYTTGYRWDNLRRIVGIIKPDPDGSGPIGFPAVRYTYDADDNVVETETGFLAAWQDQTVLPANWTGFAVKSIKFDTVDAMGNKTQEKVTDGSQNPLTLTQTSYDGDDRASCVAVRMNLATTATAACSLGTAGAYGNDRITVTQYDGEGHVANTQRAVGTGNAQYYARYGYSPNGNKTAETDANNNLTNYAYDDYDRLADTYYPNPTSGAGASNLADYESYVSDKNDNRSTYRRRNGQSYAYSYDAINRQTSKTRTDNAGLNVNSAYDLVDHLIQAQFANGSGSVSYSYDAVGRVLTTTDMFGRTLSYQYDQGSLRTLMTFPDSQQQGYQYNPGNQLSWTGVQGTSFGYTVAYDTYDRAATITRSNNANTAIAYDNADRVTSYGHTFTNSNRNVTWGFTFNPASEIINTSTTNTDFDYREQQSTTEAHTFNGLNQDAGIAALATSCSTAGAGFDCDGNLTNDSTRSFTYDIDNHLTALSGPASVSYVYDPIGRLAQTTVNGTVTTFLYDGTNLVGEYGSTSSSAPLLIRYMHTLGTDQPWVQFTGSAVGATNAKYLYANYQGSIVALADGSGTVADSDVHKYGPYGEPRDINNNLSFSGSRFLYTGQTAMPEASLYYYKARVYDPVFGRFLQIDPIGSKDNLDLYAYTADDPVDKTDPTGECPECVGLIVGAIVGGGVEVLKETVVDHRDLHHLDGGAIAREAIIGGVAGATGVGAGMLVEKVAGTVAVAAVSSGVTAGMSSAMHGDKPAAVAVNTAIGVMAGGGSKYLGGKATAVMNKMGVRVPGNPLQMGSATNKKTADIGGKVVASAVKPVTTAVLTADCNATGHHCK